MSLQGLPTREESEVSFLTSFRGQAYYFAGQCRKKRTIYTPQLLMLGRQIKADSGPRLVMGGGVCCRDRDREHAAHGRGPNRGPVNHDQLPSQLGGAHHWAQRQHHPRTGEGERGAHSG